MTAPFGVYTPDYTPNRHLPYPSGEDSADVPRDIKALADTLDNQGGAGGGGLLAAARVLDMGVSGQVRAGRQLATSDFTALGLSAPLGLWNLSDLTDASGNGRALINKGAVPFGVGINGLANTAAVFSGSTAQALYIADTGAADPFRIKTGSWGCWFRTAKRGTTQQLVSKWGASGAYALSIFSSNLLRVQLTVDGTTQLIFNGVSDVCDDRWHHVIVVYDGTTSRLYVDGLAEAVASPTGSLFPGVGPLNIGALGADAGTAATESHYGRVDEVFVTADVLTDDQVRCLYAVKLAHTLGRVPTSIVLYVHRRRRGASLVAADFTTQPLRLHNFTAGALTDEGSGGQALVNNGPAISVSGADGSLSNAFSFAGAQSLSATDAGLPAGTTARSYGCWFKTAMTGAAVIAGWGTLGTGDARVNVGSGGVGLLSSNSGADAMTGPFVADGQWHQVIVSEDNAAGDGVRRRLYLDGRVVGGSTVLNPIVLAGANRFRIGADQAGGSPYTGQVDGPFVCGYAMAADEIARLYAKGSQDLGASPKNVGDHIERVDASSVLFIGDTLDSQYTVDLGVIG